MAAKSVFIRTGIIGAKAIAEDSGSFFSFGRFKCKGTQMFYCGTLTMGFVNLRPIMPGHVLVCPKRVVERIADLTEEELCDLMLITRTIASAIETKYEANGLNIAIQDGAAAGQSVPHVHVHIIPRRGPPMHKPDLERNDEIYERMEDFSAVPGPEQASTDGGKHKLHVPPDSERIDRSEEEMATEAEELRNLMLQIFREEAA